MPGQENNFCDAFQLALECVDELVAIVDNEHIYRMANRAFLEKRGLSRQCVVGAGVRDVLGQELYTRILPHLERCFQGYRVEYFLDVVYPEDGMRHLHVSYTPLQEEDGAVGRILSIIKDVTSVRQMEDISRRHDATYAKLFLESPAVMLVVDPGTGLIIDSNNASSLFYGRSKEELCLLPVSELEAPECRGDMLRFGTHRTATLASRHVAGLACKDVEIHASTLNAGPGHMLHFTIHDVDDSRKQAVRNAFLASIVHSTHDAVIGMRLDGGILSWNKGAQNVYGYAEEEMIGADVRVLVPSPLLVEFESLLQRVRQGEQVDSHESRHLRKDGAIAWVSLIFSPIKDERDVIRGISAIARDITERKDAEHRIAMLAGVVEHAQYGIMILDREFRVNYVNVAFSRLTGLSAREILGSPAQALLQQVEVECFENSVLGMASWEGRLALVGAPGRVFKARALTFPEPGGVGRNRVCILRDSSREDALELQLRQAQKMEALGTLASGVAHDFNNVLASIMVNAETGRMLGDTLHPILRECLDDINRSSKRGAELVKNILTFCRQAEQELKPLHMQSVVKETIKLLRATLPVSLELKFFYAAEEAVVIGDPSQIHQVVMNLCLNAMQAMPNGGVLEVRLEMTQGHNVHGEKRQYVLLRVADHGCGIPAELLPRVCDPFFTTKKPGEGTGLGLSIVHGIVSSYSGTMDIASRPGKGTVVSVRLPLVEMHAQQQEAVAKPMLPGKGKLLLVVDDSIMLHSLERGLRMLGYEPLAVSCPRRALDFFVKEGAAVELLLCDQETPGLSGVQLVAALRELAPAIPVVLFAQDGLQPGSATVRDLEPCELLQKPVSVVELNNAIRRLLQQGGADPQA